MCNCMAQGLLHDTYFYGRDAKQLVPTVVSPTEFFDGAIISGNCVSPGSKTTTYHHLNNAVIKALWAKHGKELNFVGIILNPLMVTLKEKQRDIMMSVRIATEEFGADAAIISQEGFGNPTTDLMHVCRGLEKRGVKTVIITNEDAGTDGMSESLPDVVTEPTPSCPPATPMPPSCCQDGPCSGRAEGGGACHRRQCGFHQARRHAAAGDPRYHGRT